MSRHHSGKQRGLKCADNTVEKSIISCVGDSITFGYKVPPDKSYPSLLQAECPFFEVRNFGVNSATARRPRRTNLSYWNTNEYQQSLDSNPAVVIMMLGTNDVSPAWSTRDDTAFVKDYTDLLLSYRKLPSQPTIFLAIPPPIYDHKKDFVITNNVPALITDIANHVRLAEDTGTGGVHVVDVHGLMGGMERNCREYFMDDGVHPNEEGYMVMASHINDVLRTYLPTIHTPT